MSMNPHIGHLYHDGNITSVYTVLDAREKIRTREINAREAKTLDRYSVVLDRAKRVCRRQNEWEQLTVRRHLTNIKSRTPSLAISLRNESDRLKLHSILGDRLMDASGRDGLTSKYTQSARGHRQPKVSPWSIYSHTTGNGHKGGRSHETCKTAPPSRYRSSRFKDNSDDAKTENLARRADQVTRSLHSLYTKSFERKWKEKDLTVLDILNRNSKEELEKALFVLRGTPTGEAIEDILRERELVSKTPSERVLSAKDIDETEEVDKISDEVFITRLGEAVVRQDDNSKPRSNSRTSLERDLSTGPRSSTAHSKRVNSSSGQDALVLPAIENNQNPEENAMNRWNNSDNPLSVKEVFERDNTFLLSSTLANPSETDAVPTCHRWRDIFKAPELWKRSIVVPKVKVKAKPVSIVTLTGKYRQTMLK